MTSARVACIVSRIAPANTTNFFKENIFWFLTFVELHMIRFSLFLAALSYYPLKGADAEKWIRDRLPAIPPKRDAGPNANVCEMASLVFNRCDAITRRFIVLLASPGPIIQILAPNASVFFWVRVYLGFHSVNACALSRSGCRSLCPEL